MTALPVAHQESYREERLSAGPAAHTVPYMLARPIALLAACLEALPVDCPVDNPEFCLTACSGPIIWQIPTHFSHPLPSNTRYPCVELYPYSSREHTTASRISDVHTLAIVPYGSGNPHPTVQSRELYQPLANSPLFGGWTDVLVALCWAAAGDMCCKTEIVCCGCRRLCTRQGAS